jgi:hypothetical protein
MDRIEDSEIAPLWAEHFPRRHQTAVSLTLIFALMLIVARKAGRSSAINDVLAEFEIPADEFDRVINLKWRDHSNNVISVQLCG